jgi:hypothetical protein
MKFEYIFIAILFFGCGKQPKETRDFKSSRFAEVNFYTLKGLKPVVYENRNNYPQFDIINLDKNKVKVINYYSEKTFYEETFEKGNKHWYSIENNIEEAEYNGKNLNILEKDKNISFSFRPMANGKIQLTSFYEVGENKYKRANFQDYIVDSISETHYPKIDSLVNSSHLITKTQGFYSIINNKILRYQDSLYSSDNSLIETTKECYDLKKVNCSKNNRTVMVLCDDCHTKCH